MDIKPDLSLLNIKDFLNISPSQDAFIQSILDGKHSHAYLLYGEDGLAKHRLCHILANHILNSNDSSVDKLVISTETVKNQGLSTAVSSIGVAAIRDMLVPFISTLSMFSGNRVVVIEHAELLTMQVQNALLKPLESGRDDIIYFLVANELSKIIPTVKSRCIKVQIHRWDTDKIAKYLMQFGVASSLAENAANHSSGLVGRAIEIINNSTETEYLNKAIDRLLNLSSLTDAVKFSCEYAKSGDEFKNNLLDTFERIVESALHKSCNVEGGYFIEYPDNWQTAIKNRQIISFNKIIESTMLARRMNKMQSNWQSVMDRWLASILEETAQWQQ